jgi:hypothetical protein
VTVCVFLSVNKTIITIIILELICFRNFIAYTITMVNGLFKIRTSSKTDNSNQIVQIFQFNDEQTGQHICAKGICDRSSCFEIIQQKPCRSYGEQVV